MRYKVTSKSNQDEWPLGLIIFQYASLQIAYLVKDGGLPIQHFNDKTLKGLKDQIREFLQEQGEYEIEAVEGTNFDEETRKMFDGLIISYKSSK